MKVYIQGSCFAGSIRAMLMEYTGLTKFKKAASVEEADMILYTGGADVSPMIYQEPSLAGTSVDPRQDKEDKETYRKALLGDKFQVGICRGAQFLNVMNGGTLWQDINNHGGRNHDVFDHVSKKTFEVSSLHHQGIIVTKSADILATCLLATKKRSYNKYWDKALSTGTSPDIEAYFYPDTKCLGVQWHPELGPQSCIDRFFDYIEMFRDTVKASDSDKERQVG